MLGLLYSHFQNPTLKEGKGLVFMELLLSCHVISEFFCTNDQMHHAMPFNFLVIIII